MLWLQTHFSEGGFWIGFLPIAVMVIGAAIYFRRPPVDGTADDDRVTWGSAAKVVAYLVIVLTVWWLLARMIVVR